MFHLRILSVSRGNASGASWIISIYHGHRFAGSLLAVYSGTKTCEYHQQVSYMSHKSIWHNNINSVVINCTNNGLQLATWPLSVQSKCFKEKFSNVSIQGHLSSPYTTIVPAVSWRHRPLSSWIKWGTFISLACTTPTVTQRRWGWTGQGRVSFSVHICKKFFPFSHSDLQSPPHCGVDIKLQDEGRVMYAVNGCGSHSPIFFFFISNTKSFVLWSSIKKKR